LKLLLDTNVLVAALIARGTCNDLLEHCVRHHVLISSRPLLDELRDVLIRKFRSSEAVVRCSPSGSKLTARGFKSPRNQNASEASAENCHLLSAVISSSLQQFHALVPTQHLQK
jgi:predicted nucleic acid-binding protein